MYHISFYIAFLFVITGCQKQDSGKAGAVDHPHYSIDLKISPQTGAIDVSGNLLIPAGTELPDTLSFYLQRKLHLLHFRMNGKQFRSGDTSRSDNRFMPFARMIHLTPDTDSAQKSVTKIDFSYGGNLEVLPGYFANTFGPEWTEIGKYYPWFPCSPALAYFTYHVIVRTDTAYQVFGIGETGRENGDRVLSTDFPTNDIVVCLSRDVNKHQSMTGNVKLIVYHYNFSDSLAVRISDDISTIKNLYNAWFGEQSYPITIIQSRRRSGGGYARVGGLFLAGINSESYLSHSEGYYRYFGHELAHLWWNKADASSWEDWLNESFAEFSALLILRHVFGVPVYERRLEKKRLALGNIPPVQGFDRIHSEHAHDVLYNKGPVLLDKLAARIGEEQFLKICKLMATQRVKHTSALIRILEEEGGTPVASWFSNLLHTY